MYDKFSNLVLLDLSVTMSKHSAGGQRFMLRKELKGAKSQTIFSLFSQSTKKWLYVKLKKIKKQYSTMVVINFLTLTYYMFKSCSFQMFHTNATFEYPVTSPVRLCSALCRRVRKMMYLFQKMESDTNLALFTECSVKKIPVNF